MIKTIYEKDLKTYLTNILTYISITLILAVYAVLFTTRIFSVNLQINYEAPMYSLIPWIKTLLPILMFLTYSVQKSRRVDTQLYTSNASSSSIILAKILSISAIFVVPFLIILASNILLKLTIFTNSDMVMTSYILVLLSLFFTATFSTLMYTIITNPITALVLSIIIPNAIFFALSSFGLEQTVFMPYLLGILPAGPTLMYISATIFVGLVTTLILNKKRNII